MHRLFKVVFLLSFSLTGQAQSIQRPKLVVGIIVDQMRWDYLYRYYDRYSNDGFKRLLRGGFSCENTLIPYAKTHTAAGHSSIYTGSVPAIHGIVSNNWIERETESLIYCTGDSTEKTVGSPSRAGEMSPRNLLTTTIGDELKLATNFRSKVIGIALKDRGGILPAGHFADAAYWFDDLTGKWITSTYYMNALPGWVSQYNNLRKPDVLMKKDWNLLYDKSTYQQSTEDDMTFEKVVESDNSRKFPHSYNTIPERNNYLAFRVSPYGNTYTLDFARDAISHEKLGKGAETDMLCISLSSTDYLGHRFGPNSLEMEDTYLRLDQDIAAFLSFLDKEEGKNNYLVFLTTDHGAPNIAAFLKQNKFNVGNQHAGELVISMNKACMNTFGDSGLVKKIYESDVYINTKRLDSLHLNKKEVKVFLMNYLKSLAGVMNVIDVDELQAAVLPAVIKEKLANSFYWRRSGDIIFILKSQYTDYTQTGLEHGTWYPYDAHIPLLWYGWGIRQGTTYRETSMTDIAPTIAALLHIQMPGGCIGHVIEDVMKQKK